MRVNSVSGNQVIGKLESITGDLQRAAVEGKWNIDWPKMNRLVEKANESIKNGQQAMAIRCYARSISFLMDQLRHQSEEPDSELGIEPDQD